MLKIMEKIQNVIFLKLERFYNGKNETVNGIRKVYDNYCFK